MITGLTLGKYAPLHKGHEDIFLAALEEVDKLFVVIYDSPRVIDVPLPVRANWIRSLSTSIEVIEAWGGPDVCGDTPEIKKGHEDYLKDLLGGRKIDRFYSSEFYGEHISKALNAMDCRLNKTRPICATAIRANPYACRKFLDPAVYNDLITNIVFLGAPSTGKTTIAQEMAEEFNTVWMPEYGREYWEKHNIERRLTVDQLGDIALGHYSREEALLKDANKYLFTDTNALTTRIFSLYYHGVSNKWVNDLADIAYRRYDLVFLCDTDIPYDDTPDRSGEGNRADFQKMIIADLNHRRIPYINLSGNLETRKLKVKEILCRFKKYRNFFGVYL